MEPGSTLDRTLTSRAKAEDLDGMNHSSALYTVSLYNSKLYYLHSLLDVGGSKLDCCKEPSDSEVLLGCRVYQHVHFRI